MTEAAAASVSGGKYTTRYDHIDVDAILRSARLLKSYMECVMDRGPCTREGLELKSMLKPGLKNKIPYFSFQNTFQMQFKLSAQNAVTDRSNGQVKLCRIFSRTTKIIGVRFLTNTIPAGPSVPNSSSKMTKIKSKKNYNTGQKINFFSQEETNLQKELKIKTIIMVSDHIF